MIEENGLDSQNEDEGENENDVEENENENELEENEQSASKPKTVKKAIVYPDEIVQDERYSLFLKIYRDREKVDSLVADAVKQLKVLVISRGAYIETKEQDDRSHNLPHSVLE